jgi:hypothetical protein
MDTFHKNMKISGSPPVVAGPLDDVDFGDQLDGFYVVAGQDLGDVAGYASTGAACGVSEHEQQRECDALEVGPAE